MKLIAVIVNALLPFLVFVPCAELAPTFTASPPDPFYVLEGNNITLMWHYNLDGSFDDVVFRFIGSTSTLTIVDKHDINRDAAVPESVYQGRILENINATQAEITIFALQRSESGEYEIELINSNRLRVSDRVTVQVQYPPELNVSGDVVVIEGGPSVTLVCTADGEPIPNITWTRLRANETDSGVVATGNQFVLENNRNNSGTYRCTAYNAIGTALNRTVTVNVNYKPENVKLMVNDSVVSESDVISITCSADGQPAVHTYQLFENEIPVNNGNSSAGAWIRKDLKEGDVSYRCVANNTVGTTETTVNVTLKDKPEKFNFTVSQSTVCQGSVVTFNCSADGNPPVDTYQLLENGVPMRNGSSSPGMWSKNMSTGGVFNYKCMANNSVGTAYSMTATVTVHVSSSVQAMQEQNVTEGHNFTLTCNVSEIPPPLVSWIRPDGQSVAGKVLEFMKINRSEAGEYTCEASNECGNSTEMTSINVQFKPENVELEISAMNDKVCQGDVVNFTCSAIANPAVSSYQLFENDTAILPKNAEGMWNRTFTSGGVYFYKCVASNTMGSINSTSVMVTVNVPSKVYPLENITVIEGENRTLTCNVSGSPALTVTWTEVSSRSQSNGIMRYLTNINRSNAGEYVCKAKNDCGNSSARTFLTVLYKPEKFNFTVSNSTVCQGSVVTFNCSADANPPVDTYHLLENGVPVRDSSNSPGMWSRSMSTGGVFNYKCMANNSAGTAYSISVTVTVNVLSSIQAIRDQNVTEGHNFTLTCNVSGLPPPWVSWIKPDGQSVAEKVLEFMEINRSKAGEYTCEASNECGNSTEMASIDVQFKPENVELAISAMNNKSCLGDVVNFTCSAHANPAVSLYQLFENDTALLDTNAVGMWNRTFTSGGVYFYTCVANNTLGSINSTSVMLKVNVPPKVYTLEKITVIEGENRTLTCNVSGSPVLAVTWTKAGSRNQSIGIMLYLTNISRNNAGEYECKATNDCGNSSAGTFLIVLYKPEKFNFTVSNSTVCQGSVVTFNCSADANPPVDTYHLLENGVYVRNGSNSLEMWSRNMSTGGVFNYKCIANNSVGTAYSMSVTVTVNVPSSIQAIQDQNVTEGHSFSLTCNVTGMPSPWVSWIKPDGQSVAGKVLEFLKINRSEAGEYTCEASNECGNSTEMASIDVQFKPENVELAISAMNNKACLGDVVNFTCSAIANPAVSLYQLFENDTALLDKNAVGMWNRTFTSGGVYFYKCVANNTMGSINVPSKVYPSENITMIEGENRTLTCNVSGSPVLTVTWTEVSSRSQSNGIMRYLTNISRNNAGEYECKAINDCGNSSVRIFLTVLYKPEKFNFTVSNSTVCQGSVVTFNCSADANPPVDTYHLLENGVYVRNGSNGLGMWSRNMSTGGVFNYKCIANNSVGTAYSMSVTVTVNVLSSIQAIQDLNVTEGHNLFLTCNVSGMPPPWVSWIKPNGQSVAGKVLEFMKIDRSEAGEYTCAASHECGNPTEIASIDVQYKPEKFNFTVSNSTVCQGSVVTFNCSANGIPLVDTYELLENGVLVRNGSNSLGMWSRNMSTKGVFNYKCMAKNSVGTAYSMSLNVTVDGVQAIDNRTVTEGGNVTLTCQTYGRSFQRLTWFKPDGQSGDENVLELVNISRNEAGEYRCEVHSECGNETETVNIDVQYKPEIVDLKTSSFAGTHCQGDIISFNCSAYANPSVASYQLFENETAILDTNPSGMWNRRLPAGGVFMYKCMANNYLGSEDSLPVIVEVNVPSSIPALQDQSATEGDNVTLSCPVSGMPPPVVSWMTPNGQRHSGNMLELTSINRSEAGEYKCEASNECGNATRTASIHVQLKLPGNPCLVECTNGQTCREFGKHFCLCPKGKKGKDCKENDTVTIVIMISLKISNKKWREELTDLSDLDTQLFVGIIIRSVDEEFKGSGVREINVTHLREGSVIADISLTFDEPVGESEVESLLLDAINDGSLGTLKVDTFSVGSTISVTVPRPVPSEPAKVNKDAIYGSVIGVLAFMFAVAIIFIAWKRRKREKDDRLNTVLKESHRPHINEAIELESSDGNLSTVVHHGRGNYMELNEVRSLNEPATDPARSYLEINEYAPLHPGTRSWEVERENVTIEKVIGKGAFGQVAQGKASNLRGREETITVAIKMLKDNATDTERKDLLSELEVLKKLKPHPHVIKLQGCVTESDPLLVLIEYVPYGDLLGYLRKSRHLEDNYFKDPDIKPQTSLTSRQLMKFSWQVADGMHYLSSKNIIHRDLAARNVLVGEQERCKVTDFGMARDVCQENIYERKSKGRLPVKWTACEALLYGRYTTKSDVWSFGIVLYEIFTIGGSPYPKIDGRKMADLLTQGYRMPKPRHVDDTLYKIMQDCWQENPDDRPIFENLKNDLKEMENQHQRLINMQHYDNILYASMD
nr:hemicentin-1-like isoform X2 [Pocillopora verrucosa]